MNKEMVRKVGIWFLAFALFAAHLFFRSVAHADELPDAGPKWKQIHAKNGECQISFPSAPQLIQQSLPIADGQMRLNYDVYIAPFEDRGVFLLLIATYPMALSGGHEVAGLEGLLKGILGHHPDNKMIFAELIDRAGYPAINFLIQSGKSYFRGEAMMVGNKLYLIAMEGMKGKLDEKVFGRFLDSFQISE